MDNDNHSRLGLGTALVHTDDPFADLHVTSSISVSTTFRAREDEPFPLSPERDSTLLVYSRYAQNVTTRVEKVIGALHNAHAITYSSGLSAVYAALVYLSPKRIAISKGYHGVFGTITVYARARGAEIPLIGLEDDFEEGDVAWVETPLNPTGEARDMKFYADKIHKVGGKMVVDATFAPPPLQNPLLWGADMVMHSATKYLGGHSDLLSGVLVVSTLEEWKELQGHRTLLGNTMGSLESWLLLRSLRTLHLRIPRQSQTATALAAWLKTFTSIPSGESQEGVPSGVVVRVQHASLQDTSAFDPATQLTGGYGPTFAITLSNETQARAFPYRLQYWICATSLGGVESLIEWRKRTDAGSDPRLLRLSVGVEELEDLKSDLRQALVKVKDIK